MCSWEPSSVSLSLLPPPSSAVVLLGCDVREQPCCRKALVQIPVHSQPNGRGSLIEGKLERVESYWLITGCAVTRGNSEAPVGRIRGIDRKDTARKRKRNYDRKCRLIKSSSGPTFLHFVNDSREIGVAQWMSEPTILTHAIESLVQERQRALWQWTFSTLHSHQRATSIIHHSFSAQRLSTAG